MGWTRKAKLKWQRKASRQRYPSNVLMNGNYDRHGTFKLDSWSAEDWTGSRQRSRRYVNHKMRQAAKLMIAHELMQDEEWQEELWEIQCGWEDDDIELPNWWYGIEDDYEYPEPYPEEDLYDPYWYDDYYGEY